MSSHDVFAAVVGQKDAIAQLRAAAARPVHAYLLVGPEGLGQRDLARGFAACLLCPRQGCGECEVCRRTLAGVHPDLVEVHRSGAETSVDDAREVVRMAQRKPLEAKRQVLVVSDVHLARRASPVLLKTLEDPASTTVFILLADLVPRELATVASRCVRIDLSPLAPDALAELLVGEGVAPDVAAEVAQTASGSADRARLLASDPNVAARHDQWRSIPARLDGTGASAAVLAAELLASAEEATEPLRQRHAAEMDSLSAEAQTMGQRGVPGRKAIEDQYKREERRFRVDELRTGLAVLARTYRDRMSAAGGANGALSSGEMSRLAGGGAAVAAIEDAARELVRNPNELLMLQALLVRLSANPS